MCFNEKNSEHFQSPFCDFPLELLLTLSSVPHLIEQHPSSQLHFDEYEHTAEPRTPNLFETIHIFVWLGGKKYFICEHRLLMCMSLLSNFN